MGTYACFRVEEKQPDGTWKESILNDKIGNESFQNYDLYAMLANVRNYEGYNCISTPKGIPDDSPLRVHMNQLEDMYFWETYDHTWLTLKEILEFDWNQTITHRHYLNPHEYDWVKTSQEPPNTNSRDNADVQIGRGFIIISNEAMDTVVANGDLDAKFVTEVPGETVTYREEAGDSFFEQVVEPMKQLAGDHPENIRIVFWFD